MADDKGRLLTAETLHRIAREQVQMDLTESEVAALLPLLRDLLAEIGRIRPLDRLLAEPEAIVVTEAWTS